MFEKPMIHLYTCDACSLTVKEFEEMKREVESRVLANIAGVGDRILARLIHEHFSRFLILKHREEEE